MRDYSLGEKVFMALASTPFIVAIAVPAYMGVKYLVNRNSETICAKCHCACKWKDMAEYEYMDKAFSDSSNPYHVMWSWYVNEWGDDSLCKRCFDLESRSAGSMMKDGKEVRYYSKNYQGRIKYKNGTEIDLITDYFKDKNLAKEAIKALASYYNRDIVMHCALESEQRYDWNYIYSVWRCVGTAANRA